MIDPILITGCARSGTSMTAGIINLCGAFGGNMQGSNPYNKRGMFENLAIRNEIIKPFFRKIEADPQCQRPLPDMEIVKTYLNESFIAGWKNRVCKIFLRQGYYKGPWFIKDPKIAVHWPIWHAAFPHAKWIIVRRDCQDIINSCMKTGFMRAYKTEEGWREWVVHHQRCFHGIINCTDVRQIWPQDMINCDFRPIRHCVIQFLDLKWKEKDILNFITPALWSNARRKQRGKSNDHRR